MRKSEIRRRTAQVLPDILLETPDKCKPCPTAYAAARFLATRVVTGEIGIEEALAEQGAVMEKSCGKGFAIDQPSENRECHWGTIPGVELETIAK